MGPQLRVHVYDSSNGDGGEKDTVFFVHGWPDDESVWSLQVEHLVGEGYRCCTCSLPHFDQKVKENRSSLPMMGPSYVLDGNTNWRSSGYNFSEIVDLLAEAVQRSQASQDDKRVVLCIHDWGSWFGFYLQTRYPHLVKKIVALDVGFPRTGTARFAQLPLMVTMGVAYQYYLSICYLIGRFVPFIGPSIGNYFVRWMVGLDQMKGNKFEKRLGDHKHLSLQPKDCTANQCYPYYFVHKQFLLELLGLRNAEFPFPPTKNNEDAKHNRKPKKPSCPTLFLWGNKKGFKFHSGAWERALEARDDCMVYAVKGGHWIQLERPSEVNEKMSSWLKSSL